MRATQKLTRVAFERPAPGGFFFAQIVLQKFESSDPNICVGPATYTTSSYYGCPYSLAFDCIICKIFFLGPCKMRALDQACFCAENFESGEA